MRAIVGSLLASMLSLASPGPQQLEIPSGEQALASMRATYSGCGSYADSCSFAVSFGPSNGPPNLWSQGTLSTKFVRGQALRADASFGIGDAPPQLSYVVHSSADRHRLARYSRGQPEPKVLESDSLEYVLGATTGSTGLMAAPLQYVASLLLANEFHDLGCAQLAHPLVEAVEPMGDSLCLRIHAEGSNGTLFTLWVDHESWLLRRLSRDDPMAELRRVTTIEFHGTINASIAPSELTFP